MQKLNSTWQRPHIIVLLSSFVMAVLAPIFFKLVHMSVAWRVGLLFIVLNTSFAWWIGRQIKTHKLFWGLMLFFPALFAIMIFWRYARYGYWFVPLYLVTTLLAMLKD